MDKKKVYTEAEKQKIIKQIKHNYECEKMPLSERDVKDIKDILDGKKTDDQVVAEQIKKMQEEGLIK